MPEASIRFALSNPGVSTVLGGLFRYRPPGKVSAVCI
ncbi:MAG: hypothetical protein CM1200mP22_22270 [Dehalococcoidia bacterium]|nr:MAG: hypothetical protein CM1200mP22_22270 [Dehalococcoidia bacterium]